MLSSGISGSPRGGRRSRREIRAAPAGLRAGSAPGAPESIRPEIRGPATEGAVPKGDGGPPADLAITQPGFHMQAAGRSETGTGSAMRFARGGQSVEAPPQGVTERIVAGIRFLHPRDGARLPGLGPCGIVDCRNPESPRILPPPGCALEAELARGVAARNVGCLRNCLGTRRDLDYDQYPRCSRGRDLRPLSRPVVDSSPRLTSGGQECLAPFGSRCWLVHS